MSGLRRPTCVRTPARHERRSGAVLLLVALFALALFGIAGLVLDVGQAWLAHRSMQMAVDPAAIEGLRWRDWAQDGGRGDEPQTRDALRRAAASLVASLPFDDDLYADDVGPADDPYGFGAGVVLDLEYEGSSQVMEELGAGMQIRLPDPPVYKPRASNFSPLTPFGLEFNLVNNQIGDMVAGDYLGLADPLRPGLENRVYSRNDFTPTIQGDRLASASAPSFLVRMRRSRDRWALDSVPQVSSTGPPIRFLWALGSGLRGDPDESYDPRREGLTVRATAIATEKRAWLVGGIHYERDLPGAGFALERSFWDPLPIATKIDVFVHGNGDITTVGGRVVGYFHTGPSQVGSTIQRGLPPPDPDILRDSQVWPIIYQNIEEEPRTIGFGACRMGIDLPDDLEDYEPPVDAHIYKYASRMAHRNAAAVSIVSLPNLSPSGFEALFRAHETFLDPLLAPALAR